jgi:hypothetical protein
MGCSTSCSPRWGFGDAVSCKAFVVAPQQALLAGVLAAHAARGGGQQPQRREVGAVLFQLDWHLWEAGAHIVQGVQR